MKLKNSVKGESMKTERQSTRVNIAGERHKKVGSTRIIPISAKVVIIFCVLLLTSNFSTNYITVLLSRKETMDMINALLVSELKELYTNAGNQYQILQYSNDANNALQALILNAENNFTNPNSWVAGVRDDGSILFESDVLLSTKASMPNKYELEKFCDPSALAEMLNDHKNGISEGARFFNTKLGECFGVYKYHDDWDVFLIRADLMQEMMKKSNKVFLQVSIIIISMSIIFIVVGFIAIVRILRFVNIISSSLYDMQKTKSLKLINMNGASNDDIAYLGISFNGLSSTINNLVTVFRKFTTQDIVTRVYDGKQISLSGTQRELTILFSDIRGFTHMTEVLGHDVIDLLNLHYDKAIREIHKEDGIIGSIIGDALLAVYGIVGSNGNKSLQALNSGWAIYKAASVLRNGMAEKRKLIEEIHSLDDVEKNYFDAVMLDIGVGIDGGTVFYGTIGSHERMTSTVIGDNVNSSSRLEGLTRIYGLPIIVSDYIKDEVMQVSNRYRFFEVDTVKVKGKTSGQKIWYPLDTEQSGLQEIDDWEIFSRALSFYYEGDWEKAAEYFLGVKNNLGGLFLSRIGSTYNKKPPQGWNGVWTMESK